MKNLLTFEQFVLNEATMTTHFADRLAERTFKDNLHLGLSESFWKNFEDKHKTENNIKSAIKKKVEDNVYNLLAKTYGVNESALALVLNPKIEFEGKTYTPNLKVTSKDKSGQERVYSGMYWAVVHNNKLLTIYCKEDKGDDALISDMQQHIKREHSEIYNSIEKFTVDRKTSDHNFIIKMLPNGEVFEEEVKFVSINTKEFQSVVKIGSEITYLGYDVNKNLVKKSAIIEAITKLNGHPIDYTKESDVTPGVKVFFTNKASKSFVPGKDVLMYDNKRAELTKIFLDKRMANPLNFMLRVRE